MDSSFKIEMTESKQERHLSRRPTGLLSGFVVSLKTLFDSSALLLAVLSQRDCKEAIRFMYRI